MFRLRIAKCCGKFAAGHAPDKARHLSKNIYDCKLSACLSMIEMNLFVITAPTGSQQPWLPRCERQCLHSSSMMKRETMRVPQAHETWIEEAFTCIR